VISIRPLGLFLGEAGNYNHAEKFENFYFYIRCGMQGPVCRRLDHVADVRKPRARRAVFIMTAAWEVGVQGLVGVYAQAGSCTSESVRASDQYQASEACQAIRASDQYQASEGVHTSQAGGAVSYNHTKKIEKKNFF
jgi:hypothetical protein